MAVEAICTHCGGKSVYIGCTNPTNGKYVGTECNIWDCVTTGLRVFIPVSFQYSIEDDYCFERQFMNGDMPPDNEIGIDEKAQLEWEDYYIKVLIPEAIERQFPSFTGG